MSTDLGSTEAVAWYLQREMLDDLQVVVRLEFDGEPDSKSRPRFNSKTGRAYTPKETRIAEKRVATIAQLHHIGPPDAEHAFGVFAKFYCGTWQRRDVDNMLKLVLDAMTGVVWDDDSQVSEVSASVQRGVDDARTSVVVYRTNANMPPVKPCAVCGKSVRQYPSQTNKYCGRACFGMSQRTRKELTCTTCGGIYELPLNRAIRIKIPFCSEPCRLKAQRVTGPCAQCGVEVSKPKSWTKKTLTCSVKCADKYKIGRPRSSS